ncbi:MAG: TonB-dependent receptor [Bacteroidota bacterium]
MYRNLPYGRRLASDQRPFYYRSRPLLSLLLVFCFFSAPTYGYAQEVKLSLTLRQEKITKVFAFIRQNSDYQFLYNDELVQSAPLVSLNVKDATVSDILEACFKNSPLKYRIQNHIVTVFSPDAVKKKEAEEIIIKGQVTDEKSETLPGVSLKVKGTTQAAVTDSKGNYVIKVPNEQSVLIFSYIGFTTQETLVGARREINVVLQVQQSALNEVVVIGYGQVKRGDLTGAVGSVNIPDMVKAPVRSLEEALAGRVAGVQVTSPDGQPGAASVINIRGQSSITQDNSPLYVIDGFPIENPDNNILNPADIENIEVLKDASATAIYGSRGANGVFIITTKKGKNGPPVINYNGYYGIQNVLARVNSMDPYQFVKFQLELDPANAPGQYLSNGRILEDYRNVKGINWQDQLYRTGSTQNNDFSVRGGSKDTRYSISGSIIRQKGAVINSGFNRYQGRVVLDQNIGRNLIVGINANYSNFLVYGTPASTNSNFGLIYNVQSYRPVNPSLDFSALLDNGQDVEGDYRFNPILSAQNELRNRTTNALVANGYAQYTFFEDLVLKITGGVNRSELRYDVFDNTKTRSANPVGALGQNGVNGSVTYTQLNNYVNENTLTYNKTLKSGHHINVLAGFTLQGVQSFVYGANAILVPNESLGLSGLDEGTPYSINSVQSNNTLESFLGRINYDYKSKYLLTATFRADGSSKLAPGNKWGYFPSAALAWNFNREDILKNSHVLSTGKVRVSYGEIGNNRVNDFAYYSTLTLPISSSYAPNNSVIRGAVPSAFGNPNLKWETTGEIDLGLDLGFFNDRITLTTDVYRKKTTNLLLNAQLPPTFGYSSAFKNVGSVQNEGLEFTLNTVNIANKNFKWNSSFNISFNRNKVLALTDNQEYFLTNVPWATNYAGQPPYITQIGQPIGMFYGYTWEGNYQYSDFDKQANGTYILKASVPNNGLARNQINPGFIKYRDLNGDNVVNDNDRSVIGNPNPQFIGGFNNGFTYKNFDLNVFFQWSYGNQVENATRLFLEGYAGTTGLNMLATYANRWTPDNQNNTYFATKGGGNYVYSTRTLEDGSYLKLRTVSLGYNLPSRVANQLHIRNLRVYVSGQNLATITKYTGSDPEVGTFGTPIVQSFDFSAYPRARTITFGLNITL